MNTHFTVFGSGAFSFVKKLAELLKAYQRLRPYLVLVLSAEVIAAMDLLASKVGEFLDALR